MKTVLALTVFVVGIAVLVGAAYWTTTRDKGSSPDTEIVWCVQAGEKLTPEFKREYPELRMSRAACEAISRAAP